MSSEPDASDTPAERAWDAWYEEPHWPGWPDGEVPEYPEVERLAFMAGYEAGRSEDGEPSARDYAWADEACKHDGERGYRDTDPIVSAYGERPSWRGGAVAALMRLDIADKVEFKGLGDLCLALRAGLTLDQQRVVAQDLLGEPHVSMVVHGHDVRILVPASSARQLAGGFLMPDPEDPWWDQ